MNSNFISLCRKKNKFYRSWPIKLQNRKTWPSAISIANLCNYAKCGTHRRKKKRVTFSLLFDFNKCGCFFFYFYMWFYRWQTNIPYSQSIAFRFRVAYSTTWPLIFLSTNIHIENCPRVTHIFRAMEQNIPKRPKIRWKFQLCARFSSSAADESSLVHFKIAVIN